MTLPPSQTALVLVDMQKEGRYGIEGLDAAVAATVPVVAACRAAGVAVVYTRHVSRADGIGLSTDEVLDDDGAPVYYRSGTTAVDVLDDLAPHPGDVVVDKHRWSGFHATSLDLLLRGRGVRHLLVGGFTTDCCVLTTVYDAYALDYQVHLLADMCAATNEGAHRSAVLTMANWVYGIEISSAEEMVKQLAGERHSSWRSTAPDQKRFTSATLDEVYASLV
jgi:nicotinamidase-related amidase